ncbi:tubulin-folding cofactor B [Morus bassanus]
MAAAESGAAPGPGLGLGAGSVSLAVSSSLNAFRAHKRYSTGLTIAEFKCKLELVVGSPASCMDLELYSAEEELLGRLDCDEALLGSYPVADGCRVHVIDRSGARIGEYEDVSQVEKYEMTESDYDKRPESLRSFLRQRRWGHYDTEGTRRRAAESSSNARRRRPHWWPPSLWAPVARSGCRDNPANGPPSCQTDFKPGYWVGVRYDEPLGKHDGSVGGRRYFECQPKYGAFVKPQSVTPGDFPEEDDGLEDEL